MATPDLLTHQMCVHMTATARTALDDCATVERCTAGEVVRRILADALRTRVAPKPHHSDTDGAMLPALCVRMTETMHRRVVALALKRRLERSEVVRAFVCAALSTRVGATS